MNKASYIHRMNVGYQTKYLFTDLFDIYFSKHCLISYHVSVYAGQSM